MPEVEPEVVAAPDAPAEDVADAPVAKEVAEPVAEAAEGGEAATNGAEEAS